MDNSVFQCFRLWIFYMEKLPDWNLPKLIASERDMEDCWILKRSLCFCTYKKEIREQLQADNWLRLCWVWGCKIGITTLKSTSNGCDVLISDLLVVRLKLKRSVFWLVTIHAVELSVSCVDTAFNISLAWEILRWWQLLNICDESVFLRTPTVGKTRRASSESLLSSWENKKMYNLIFKKIVDVMLSKISECTKWSYEKSVPWSSL